MSNDKNRLWKNKFFLNLRTSFCTICTANDIDPKRIKLKKSAWSQIKAFFKCYPTAAGRYGVIQKKLFKGHFRLMWTAWSKKNFCNGILGQRTISVQIFKIFGCHQNNGYQT